MQIEFGIKAPRLHRKRDAYKNGKWWVNIPLDPNSGCCGGGGGGGAGIVQQFRVAGVLICQRRDFAAYTESQNGRMCLLYDGRSVRHISVYDAVQLELTAYSIIYK